MSALALSRHAPVRRTCPLSGVKRTLPWARPHLAFDPSGPPLFTLGYSLQAYINTVTLLYRTVTVLSQRCGKQWKIQRLGCAPQWQ